MEQIIHTDVFIAGAGAAGIAAAKAVAETGMTVFVAERNPFPGGRATASAVGTICGLYLRSDADPQFAMKGFPKLFALELMNTSGKRPVKFAEGLWFLPSHPDDFEKTARTFLENNPLKLFYNAKVESCETSSGRITAVKCSTVDGRLKIIPQCVIDCSGEGVLCKSVNHEMIMDKEYQAAAIVFSMNGISGADEYQLSFSLLKKITHEIESGSIPEYFNLLSIIPYSLTDSSVLLKMGLPWKTEEKNSTAIEMKAKELVNEISGFIKSNVHGFERSEIGWIAKEVGVRTGLRAQGKNILTDQDVLFCKKTDDGICNGAWAIEYWRTGNKRVEMTYFPENDFYTIPAGCLESGEKENLFFAGKIISAEEKAIASARVIGTCLGTGYAAGILASYKAKNKSRKDAIEYIQRQMLR